MKTSSPSERTILLSSSTAAGILAFAVVLMLSAGALLMLRSEGGLSLEARIIQAQNGVAGASRLQADISALLSLLEKHLRVRRLRRCWFASRRFKSLRNSLNRGLIFGF